MQAFELSRGDVGPGVDDRDRSGGAHDYDDCLVLVPALELAILLLFFRTSHEVFAIESGEDHDDAAEGDKREDGIEAADALAG